jgi:hypothetical protein
VVIEAVEQVGDVAQGGFDLHPRGPDTTVAQVVYAIEDGKQCLAALRDLTVNAPDAISPQVALWTIPAIAGFPAELQGRRVLLVAALYAGDPADAGPVLKPHRRLATPMADLTATAPYAALQSAFDSFFPDGGRYYFKSLFTDGLDDDAIRTIVDLAAHRPNEDSFIVIRTPGGAVSRVGTDESAYPHRHARFNISIDCVWSESGDDSRVVDWARDAWERLRPLSNGGVYVNFAGFEAESDVSTTATFGPNVARPERIRSEYDPDGLFESASRRAVTHRGPGDSGSPLDEAGYAA